jgi:hypothetical protein
LTITPAGPTFVGAFEVPIANDWEALMELGAPAPIRVQSPVRRGANSVKMTVAKGQKRSELQAKQSGSTLRVQPGSTWWFADSIYLASGFPVSPAVANGWQTVLQWKDAGGTQSSSPPVSVDIHKGRFTLFGGWGCPGGHKEFRLDLGAAETGRWFDFEFGIHFNTAGKGWVDVYVNSVKKVVHYIPPCGTLYPAPYSQYQTLRVGYYRDPLIPTTGTIYHDEYRMGPTRDSVSLASLGGDPLPPPPTTPTPEPPVVTVAGATPLWNGDTFKLNTAGDKSHGGEGTLPPFQWSSAWMAGKGFVRHSNTNPAVHGATLVEDPSALTRQVIRLNADERVNNIGLVSKPYTRMEIRGPVQFGAGMTRWIISEVFIPTDIPTMTTAGWWTILSIFGPPYSGASPNSFGMSRNSAGTGNDLTWKTPEGAWIWHTPAVKGVWHILARKIKFSTVATDGFSEVWYAQRDAQGVPKGPLTRQNLVPPGLTARQTHHYATLGSHNWDGHSLNHPDVKNYHTANMWAGRTFSTLYFARFRVYDGSVAVTQIDPYFTGLK